MAPQSRDLIRKLSSASIDTDTKLRAVRCLKNEIIGSQNKKQCYLELGAVPKIVQLLASQQEKKLTVQAAATLGSFAYGNEAGVKAVVDSGGIAHLLKTLSNEDEKVVEAGVRSLKMIFQSPLSPQEVIFLHPAFDRLVALLSNPKKTFAEDAAIIFSKCCRTPGNQDQLMQSGALTGVSRLLVTQTPNRQTAALEALVSMSRQNAKVCEALLDIAGVKNELLSFTRDQNPRLRLMACSVLTNINRTLSTDTKCLLSFREQKQILQVLVKLLYDPVIQEDVPDILATLTEDRKDLQLAAYEVDAAKKLCFFLTDTNQEISGPFKIGVLRALATISHHLPDCRAQVSLRLHQDALSLVSLQIVECHAIHAITSCLESSLSGVRAAAAFCIQNMTATVTDLQYDWVIASTEPLIHLLEDEVMDVKIKACAALCNLLYEIASAKTACIETCLPLLVQLTQSEEPQLVYHAAWAFKNLTHNLPGDRRCQVLKEFHWRHVKNLIHHPDPAVQTSALCFVQNVCSSDPESIQTVMDWCQDELLTLISSKLSRVQDSAPEVIAAGLRVVSNISTGASEHQSAVMDSEIPTQLLSCLRDQRSDTIRGAAAWCVINLIWRDELPLADNGGDGARQRAAILREVGIEAELRQMQGDESLDVRERIGGEMTMARRVVGRIADQLRGGIAGAASTECWFVRSFAVAAPKKTASPKKVAPKTAKKPEKKATPKAATVTGYMLFQKEAAAKLRQSGLPFVEVSRQLAKEWAGISADRRQKFLDEAERLNAPLKQKKIESAKPLTNAYAHFCKTVWPTIMQKYPDKTFAERSRLVGEMWRNLPVEEKARRKQALATGA